MEGKDNTDLGLPDDISQMAKSCGIEAKGRSASFVLVDDKKALETVKEGFEDKVEIMGIKEAVEKYGLEDYYWRLLDKNGNDYTKKATREDGGYFVRVRKGQKVDLPLQACMLLKNKESQIIHNLVIAEEGSSISILGGCTSHSNLSKGLHVGATEVFVEKGATVNFTMIHNWTENTIVRPLTAVSVKEGGKYLSNYLCLKPVKDLKSFPKVTCEKGAQTIFNSVLYGKGNSSIEIGEDIELLGEDSRAEINSRSVLEDSANIITRGRIVGSARAKGHIECDGILLSENASSRSVPEIVANHPEVELSHEAAIGKIAEKELMYLMSRGLSKEKATNLIVRGFMKLPGMGLPEWIEKEIGL